MLACSPFLYRGKIVGIGSIWKFPVSIVKTFPFLKDDPYPKAFLSSV